MSAISFAPEPAAGRGLDEQSFARRTEEALAERLDDERTSLAARMGETIDIPVLTLELPARGLESIGPGALARAIAEALRHKR